MSKVSELRRLIDKIEVLMDRISELLESRNKTQLMLNAAYVLDLLESEVIPIYKEVRDIIEEKHPKLKEALERTNEALLRLWEGLERTNSSLLCEGILSLMKAHYRELLPAFTEFRSNIERLFERRR